MTAPAAAGERACAADRDGERRRPDRPRHARARRASGRDHPRAARRLARDLPPRPGDREPDAQLPQRRAAGGRRGRRVARTAAAAHLDADARRVPPAPAQRRVLAHALVPEGAPARAQAVHGRGRARRRARDVRGRPGRLPVVSGARACRSSRSRTSARPTRSGAPASRRSEPPPPGAAPPPPCRPEELRALLDRMVALASQRGGFTAWEYFFAFGGGTPPWISGLAQGTAIQALTRGSQLLGDPRYVAFARGALGAFEARPPLGVRAPSTSGSGRHYLIYSFSSGLRVLNGFLQSLVGLYDFAAATKDRRAERLFKAGDRAARREIPRYDTGAWSLYASGGAESDLGYHRLVRDFLQSLCDRTKTARLLRAARSVRPLPARAHARRLRRRRRRAPRRGRQRPLHALQALLRDAAGAPRREAGARAQARAAARPARAHLSPAAQRPLHASRSRPSTSSTTTRGSSRPLIVKPRKGRRAPRA